MTTCTAVTPEMFADLAMTLVQVLPALSVACLLFGQFIFFAVIAPWILRRTNVSLVDLMQNEKRLARLVRISARRLQQQGQGGAEQ